MEIDLRRVFNDLSYPSNKMKTIKLQRFLREIGFEKDFHDIDMFIVS